MELRWNPYFMRHGEEFHGFWAEYLRGNDRKLLYVLGKGFDPRMCDGVRAIANASTNAIMETCILITYDPGIDPVPMKHELLIGNNLTSLSSVLEGSSCRLVEKSVRIWSDSERNRRRIGSQSAVKLFTDPAEFKEYTDIIVDISSLPREIYFSLLGQLLHLLDTAVNIEGSHAVPNLHVIVSDNPGQDQLIRDAGLDETASYLHGFRGAAEMEATDEVPRIWIPILGEGQGERLEILYSEIEPNEICPVLPSPSLDPRRGDNLIIEYHELLFDQWRVEPTNIIYASEQNPFDVYRQLHYTIQQYERALEPIGGCVTIVSPLSNKLLSIGPLLTAYELKALGRGIGIAHVEAQAYEIIEEESLREPELFTLWLSGDPYEN